MPRRTKKRSAAGAEVVSAEGPLDVPHTPFAEESHAPDNTGDDTYVHSHSTTEASPIEATERKHHMQELEVPDSKSGTDNAIEVPPLATQPTSSITLTPGALPSFPLPDDVVFRKNPDKDDMGYNAILESISNPQTINWVRGALRTVALVSLPLFTIAVHPNTKNRLRYPMMLIASIVSTSTHQLSLGIQIGLHTWLWRGVVYMLIVGTIANAWNLNKHKGAWYGVLALSIFLAGLVSHGLMRRFMYLYLFIYLLELRTLGMYYPVIPLDTPAWSAADYFIGSLTGMAALLFPYPILTKTLVDMIMGKIFEGLGKMFMAMITFVWLPDPHAAALFFRDQMPFMKIEATLEVMPPLLWFTNWEPTEFPLHNPIRRLKLSLLRRVMALTYAAFGAGRSASEIRRQQSERAALHKIRVTLLKAAFRRQPKHIESSPFRKRAETSFHLPSTQDELKDDAGPQSTAESLQTLRENSERCAKEFGAVLMQAMTLLGTVANTPEQIVKKVPFDALRDKQMQMRRALQLEALQVMKMQSEFAEARLAKRKASTQHSGDQGDEETEELHVDDDNSPYGRTHRYHISREDAMNILQGEGIFEHAKIYVRLSELYFHLELSMIAGELISFGEQMKTYKPSMSLGRRLFLFFIVEPWNDFWSELWYLLTLARPSDTRKLKDAIRMTCAYLSATALNLELYFVPGGEYYFGTTLLLGLPVEEESLGISVNRMAGNALGCALGYMAYHNTHNLAQKIAMTLCFTFILRICKDHPMYGQTFLYSAAITMASMVMTANSLQLMTRLITSNYTIVAYMMCVMFIFPNNNIKICWGYRCKLTKVMSEIVDDVALTLRIRPECYPAVVDMGDDSHEPASYPHRNTDAMQMCSQLNVEMALADRLLSMCDKWAPFAARQHVIRGSSPFPAEASTLIQFAHKRMVAHLSMLVFGVQMLHRPRTEPISPSTARLVGGSVAEFLAEFSDSVRLLSQDFIDSLQASRKWSYPLALSHTSQLSWMRVRLFAIHVEGYVIAAKYLSRSTFSMKPEDYRQLRREGSPKTAAATRQSSELHTRDGHEVHEDRANGGDVADLQLNMSFADRFLTARRLGEAMTGDNADPEALERLHDSIYLPQPRDASFPGYGGVSQRSFAFHAPLQETAVAPNDAFPFTQDSAEREVQQHMRGEAGATRAKREKQERGAAAHDGDADESAAVESATGDRDATPLMAPYEPVMPRKTKSKVSKLILVPDDGPELEIPLYRGPAFNYIDDELVTERETDFLAIMAILCSLHGLIVELEALTGPMNTVSTYQKELHESALAIGLIDKLSDRVKAYRQKIYERYHFPTAAEAQRRPMHAQADPFADWRF